MTNLETLRSNRKSNIKTLRPSGSQRLVASVEQAGMHHGVAYRLFRRFRQRHDRQPRGLRAFADQRQRILDRCGACLDKEVDMERQQLVLNLQRLGKLSGETG